MSEEIDDLRPWGYAPGDYLVRCPECGLKPAALRETADKLATRCKPHAHAAMLAAKAERNTRATDPKRARAVTGYSGRSATSTTGYAPKRWTDEPTDRVTIDLATQPRRWSDDPWCNMTTGEADAWRKGWEAAVDAAFLLALARQEALIHGDRAAYWEAHWLTNAITDMKPPS